MNKTLVLIRHAHRDNTVRSKDNGLSEKGREQARWLKKYFVDQFALEEGIWLVSSPKKRCLETLNPISVSASLDIDIHPDLDEQGAGESLEKFEERVHRFLHEWTLMPQPLTLVSTHGDWLPSAVFHLLGCAQIDFKKGSWLEINWTGQALLRGFIPTFKPFYG